MSDYINLSKADINYVGYGVQNCGNSCFFNSVNQMLFHIPEFRELLLNYRDKFTVKNADDNSYLQRYIQLLYEMKKSTNALGTDCVLDSMGSTLNDFYQDSQERFFYRKSYNQQAADEYLKKLLDLIIDVILNNQNVLIPKIIGFDTFYGLNSKIGDYLLGFNVTNIESYCKDHTNNNCFSEKNKQITNVLYIENTSNAPLTEFKYNINTINNLFTEELDKSNLVNRCEKKSIRSFRNQQYEITSKYLLLGIKYSSNNIGRSKIFLNGKQLSSSNINSIGLLSINRSNYELIGMIVHHGSLNSGHYWYNHKINGNWYEFNDSSMSHGINYNTTDNIPIMLFRKKDISYEIIKFEYDIINKIILNNLKNYYLTSDYGSSYININLKALVYYTYYLNNNNKYVAELTQLITNLKRNIAGLLT